MRRIVKNSLVSISAAALMAVASVAMVASPAEAAGVGPCNTGYAGVQNRNGDNWCWKFSNDNYQDLPQGYVDYVKYFYNASGKSLCLIDWSPGYKVYVLKLASGKTSSNISSGPGAAADAIGEC